MPELMVYRQCRVDAGIRAGIELDGDTIFGRFHEGGPEEDPILLWYVDLRCSGPGLPDEPLRARDWLLAHEEEIRSGFAACASEIEAGRDVETYPYLWSRFANPPVGVEMTIACATNGRIWAISIPKLIRDVGEHWREYIEEQRAAEWVA